MIKFTFEPACKTQILLMFPFQIKTDDIPLPEQFPEPIEAALKSKTVTENQINIMVHRVSSLVRSNKVQGRPCKLAEKCAKKLAKKYSPLKKKDPNLVSR